MEYSTFALPVALALLSLGLLVAEAFLPGLILGSLGLTLAGVSVALVAYHHGAATAVTYGLVMALGLTVLFFAWFKTFHRTRLGRKLILRTAPATAPEKPIVSIGDHGRALSPLRPTGAVLIGSRRYHVRTYSEFIDQGSEVITVSVSDFEIIVRRLRPDESSARPD